MSGAPGAAVLAVDPPKPPAKPISGWKQLNEAASLYRPIQGPSGRRHGGPGGYGHRRHASAAGLRRDHGLSLRKRPAARPAEPDVSPRLTYALIRGLSPVRVPTRWSSTAWRRWSSSRSKGVFSFWSRWILIGLSRDIEYDLRNDLLDRLLADGARILRAQPHRRADVARHQRSERRCAWCWARASCTAPPRLPPWCWRSSSCCGFPRRSACGF